MQNIVSFRWNIIKYNYIKFVKLVASYSPISLNIFNILYLGILIWVWQVKILPTEIGYYSPFENSLSYIKYLILIIILNTAISFSSSARSKYWIYLPIIFNFVLLTLSLFYFYSSLRTSS